MILKRIGYAFGLGTLISMSSWLLKAKDGVWSSFVDWMSMVYSWPFDGISGSKTQLELPFRYLDPEKGTLDVSLVDFEVPVEEVEDPVSCKCSGSCWYKTGKKSCPCKSGGQNCTARCSCGRRRACSNRAPAADTTTDTSSDEGEPIPKLRRKATANTKEDRHLENVKKLVTDLERGNLEKVAIMCLTRFPDAYLDVVSSLQTNPDAQPNPAPPNQAPPAQAPPNPAPPNPAPTAQAPPNPAPINPLPPEPARNLPWCICGRCRVMPSERENLCCRIRTCITSEQHFQDVVVNANVLATCMAASNDNFPRNIPRSNESYRHYAYKQYTYMHHGHLGAGNRRVVPSCAVCHVREVYPNATRQYKGYTDGMHD